MDTNVGGVDQPKRIVAIFYVLAALALGIFLEKVIALVLTYARVNDFSVFGDWTLSTVIGFVAAAVASMIALAATAPGIPIVWDEGANFRDLVMNDNRVTDKLSREELDSLFDVNKQLRNVDKIFARVFGE